jgi:hypothetical protein
MGPLPESNVDMLGILQLTRNGAAGPLVTVIARRQIVIADIIGPEPINIELSLPGADVHIHDVVPLQEWPRPCRASRQGC